MRSTAWKIAGVCLGIAVAAIAIGFYVGDWLLSAPPTYDAQTSRTSARITIQTVAAVGPQLSANPDWVSYLIRKPSGNWERSTIWTVPAHALVQVTIYQFDGDSGLRNPFLARTQGLVGTATLDGKPFEQIKPDNASHTFAIPQLGVLVPLEGVPDDAKNQCGTRRATRRAWLIGRSRSRSGPGRKASSAGSASSLAPQDSSSGSAARCRPSATWTAT